MTWRGALLLLALAVCGAGCSKAPAAGTGTPSPPATSAWSAPLDVTGRSRLAAISTEVKRLGICTAECLEALQSLHALAPGDPGVRELLIAAHVARKNWDALVALEEERPPGPRSRDEQVYLANLQIQAGRYQEAADVLAPLAAANPQDGEVARLAGMAFFHLGDHGRATPMLETAMARLPPREALEPATLRGLVHFHRGERDAAEKVLLGVLRVDPDHYFAHQALGRVLAAGNDPRAKVHLERASALRREVAEQDRRAALMSARSQMASQAVREQRWDDCERLVAQMLEDADRQQQVGLYKFLGEVRKAAGRTAEAEAALRKAEELSRGRPAS